MTGDVFSGATIPGCSDHEFVMVLAHPCSLRVDGVVLVDRVQMLPVVERAEPIGLGAWQGLYRVMPLPELRSDERCYVAKLTEFGMVQQQNLGLDNRIACLTEEGVCLLQQRFFHNQSRVRVGLDSIHEQSAPNFVEIELWEQWNEQLVAAKVDRGEDRAQTLVEEGRSFDALMRTDLEPGLSLREALKSARRRARVRQLVLTELDGRSSSDAIE
jgi:hypothetical protein